MDFKKTLPSELRMSLIPMTLLFIFLLFYTIFDSSIVESTWPYLLMIGGVILFLLLVKINAPVSTVFLTLASLMIILFGVQFLFYFVLPDYYDYQPIGDSRLMMIYQLLGKMQVFYSPDYPKQGDTIICYISACSNDYSKCVDLESYNIKAYSIDKSGTKHLLLEQRLSNRTKFQIEYLGDPIHVEMMYYNNTYAFILPKESLWQTFWVEFNRHPCYGALSLIATVLGILTIFKISEIRDFLKKCKNAYLEDINKIKEFLYTKNKKNNN